MSALARAAQLRSSSPSVNGMPSTMYLRNSRRGSLSSRWAHSSPSFCIHRGARCMSPEMKLRLIPIPRKQVSGRRRPGDTTSSGERPGKSFPDVWPLFGPETPSLLALIRRTIVMSRTKPNGLSPRRHVMCTYTRVHGRGPDVVPSASRSCSNRRLISVVSSYLRLRCGCARACWVWRLHCAYNRSVRRRSIGGPESRRGRACGGSEDVVHWFIDTSRRCHFHRQRREPPASPPGDGDSLPSRW